LAGPWPPRSATADTGLKDIAAVAGLLYGAAIAPDGLDKAPYAEKLARECSVFVPTNSMKWGSVEAVRGQLNFSAADRIADFAAAHGAKLRGHTLIWHGQLPSWAPAALATSQAETLMMKRVIDMVDRYKGRIHSWDVVNECVDVASGRPDSLRVTPFLTALGPGYIDLAFHTAHDADPGAILAYNDFGLEQDRPEQERKRRAVLKLLEGMLSRNVPVQALGIQSHLLSGSSINQAQLANFLAEVVALRLKVMVTELDVDDRRFATKVSTRDAKCAELVRSYLDVVLATRECLAVLTWGLSDKDSWLNAPPPPGADPNDTRQLRKDGTLHRPLPLDDQLRRKPMWQAMAEAFAAAVDPLKNKRQTELPARPGGHRRERRQP
jgi:endo-1,4-beta-xylanase